MIYHTNFDYELALAKQSKNRAHSPNERMNNEFSYLFLWVEAKKEKVLNSKLNFGANYIEYISKKLGEEVKSSWAYKADVSPINWWGKLENIPLETKLNSKIYQQELFKDINQNNFISGNIARKGLYRSEGELFFRPEFGFAGMGSFKFTNESFIPTKGVVTPFLEKVGDISCFYKNGEFFIYLNNISKLNSFHSCSVFRDKTMLSKELNNRNMDYHVIKESFSKGAEVIKRDFPDLNEYQMDAIYTVDNKCLINEINYRKSMGQVALKLFDFFQDRPYLNFTLSSFKKKSCTDEMIILTPKNNYNYQFITAISF
jgi:hypothetical protein